MHKKYDIVEWQRPGDALKYGIIVKVSANNKWIDVYWANHGGLTCGYRMTNSCIKTSCYNDFEDKIKDRLE